MPQNIAKSAVERTSKRLLDEVFVSLGKVKRRAVCLRFRLCKGDSPFCMLPTINIYSTAYTEGSAPFIPWDIHRDRMGTDQGQMGNGAE